MKRLLIGAACMAVVSLSGFEFAVAQNIIRVVGPPVPLVEETERPFMQPRWSPDGTRMAFTGESYRGIWIANADGSNIRQATLDEAAGFGFAWSPDGSKIVARVARYESLRRFDALKLIDVEADTESLLTEFRVGRLSLPTWSRDGAHVLVESRERLEVVAADPSSGKSVSSEPILVSRGTSVVLADPAARSWSAVRDIPDGDVINLTVAADGRAAFEIVGGNLYAVSHDGSSVIDLGRGHRPQWSPDGEWVVFMRTEDDGHDFTSSDLYIVRPDGTGLTRLTDTQNALEMNPSWSPDGARIAYDDRGTIYSLPISY